MAPVVEKSIKLKFGYENKAGWVKVKLEKITIPVQPDHTPDFAFMTTYIKAMQKIVIKNVVEWADRRIEKTKEVITTTTTTLEKFLNFSKVKNNNNDGTAYSK